LDTNTLFQLYDNPSWLIPVQALPTSVTEANILAGKRYLAAWAF